jgi:hypothetical protein
VRILGHTCSLQIRGKRYSRIMSGASSGEYVKAPLRMGISVISACDLCQLSYVGLDEVLPDPNN